jgi:hypothetical protein
MLGASAFSHQATSHAAAWASGTLVGYDADMESQMVHNEGLGDRTAAWAGRDSDRLCASSHNCSRSQRSWSSLLVFLNRCFAIKYPFLALFHRWSRMDSAGFKPP